MDYFQLLKQTGAFDKIEWTPKRSIHRLVLDKESPQREWTVFTDKDALTQELNKTWPGHEGEIGALLEYTSKVVEQVLSISELSYTNSTMDKLEKLVHMIAKCPEMRETMSQVTYALCTH